MAQNGPLDGQHAEFRAHFLDAMSRLASSVCVVTTNGSAGKAGMTVSSMTPVSADGLAPSLCVCLHHDALARSAAQGNGTFCVSVLSARQANVADVFAGRTEVAEEARFTAADCVTTAAGGLRIAGSLAAFDCELKHSFKYDTHHIMVGAVVGIELDSAGPALIYVNRAYGGVPAPLNSSDANG